MFLKTALSIISYAIVTITLLIGSSCTMNFGPQYEPEESIDSLEVIDSVMTIRPTILFNSPETIYIGHSDIIPVCDYLAYCEYNKSTLVNLTDSVWLSRVDKSEEMIIETYSVIFKGYRANKCRYIIFK